MKTISVVGMGRLGGALAIALSRAGLEIDLLIHRGSGVPHSITNLIAGSTQVISISETKGIPSEIVLVTVSDPEIANVARALAGKLGKGTVVLHTSGSLASDVLDELRLAGCSVGSLHPLLSVSDPEIGAGSFGGVCFCVEGDEAAVAVGKELAEGLGGLPFAIPAERKPLYHAAAVTASGHVAALFDVAVEMVSKCGLRDVRPETVLLPLVRSMVENLGKFPVSDALTGPYARGDAAAVGRHLASFEGIISNGAVDVYLDLAARSLEIAQRKGLDPQAAGEIRDRISMAKRNTRC